MIKKSSGVKNRIINGLAIAGLFIAFYIGQTGNKTDEFSSLEMIKTYKIEKVNQGSRGTEVFSNNLLLGRLASGKSQGYGGPLEICVLADTSARIVDIEVTKNSETFAYLNRLKRNLFFNQFKGKPLNSKFMVPDDIEAVSGATISSKAITNACRDASWKMAKSGFSLPLPEIEKHWIFGLKEILALLIFILAFLSLLLKNKTIRYISLAISLIALGFMFNSAISVSNFGRLFLGYFPDIREHFVWWLLLGGTIIAIIIYGRNVYCHAICPFHAVQILLNKLSGLNLRLPVSLSKYLIKTPKYLLWLCLMLILISKNSTIASYEPFAMCFSLEGAGIQWYILPAALFGSLVVSNFFCHYFCPVGAGFNLLVTYRNKTVKRLIKPNEK